MVGLDIADPEYNTLRRLTYYLELESL